MTEFLRNLFTRCLRRHQNGDTSIPMTYSSDVIYFSVPRDTMEAYFADGPKKWELNICSFMWLYKHATDELLEKPGHGYMYEKFVLVVDGEYMRVEGWVPIPKLDLSWCGNEKKQVNIKNIQTKPKLVRKNVVCVDISNNVRRKEELLGVKEENIYTGKALLMSKSERNKIRFLSYSRYMNPF